MLLELGVDSRPRLARRNFHNGLILVQRDALEGSQVDGYPVFDVGAPSEGRMATTSNGDAVLSACKEGTKGADQLRDVLNVGWLGDVGRLNLVLKGSKVGAVALLILLTAGKEDCRRGKGAGQGTVELFIFQRRHLV